MGWTRPCTRCKGSGGRCLKTVTSLLYILESVDYFLFLALKFKDNRAFYQDESTLLNQFLSLEDIQYWQETGGFSFNDVIREGISRKGIQLRMAEADDRTAF